MKVDYLEEGSSLRHLDIELPADTLADEFEKGVGRLSRTIRLPGFRKGKIPRTSSAPASGATCSRKQFRISCQMPWEKR